MPKQTPAEIVDKICAMREAGNTVEQIATEMGVAYGTIDYHLVKNGVTKPGGGLNRTPKYTKVEYKRKSGKVRRFTPEEDERIQHLSLAGNGPAQIGRLTGRSHNSIAGRLHRLARKQECELMNRETA